METVHGLFSPLPGLSGPVVTIGGYDGVHRGHQRILSDTVTWARGIGGEAVCITFDPLPKQVVGSGAALCITSLPHRQLLLDRCGIDLAIVLPFDGHVKNLPAAAFVDDVLFGWIGARRIVLGRDSRFGRRGEGDLRLLNRLAVQGRLEVCSPDPVCHDGRVISSTAIRLAIADGNLDRAATMLGRPFSFLGTVVEGERRGRQLGFPTANLDLHHEALPPHGVYATLAILPRGPRPSLTYIGTRPTFDGDDAQPTVEVHIIGFEGDLYGSLLEVQFLRRIRPDHHFPTAEALISQMRLDRDAALAICSATPPQPLPRRPSDS